ncbi:MULTISPECIES: hypothetical protein [Erwinia]|uniref:Colicin V n=1 Tax=Erwinia plantamica TaxID=3237104 RepID=A0ABW7CLQ7_9GAMM|nr:hypothetical protein [Erwinia sp. PsM31]MDN4627785.1 hypothetical protein [Erwinia sp. PsM31]
MKELSVIEMNEVSGAYGWDFSNFGSFALSAISNIGELAVSSVVGGAVGALSFAYVGGRHGAEGGGLLGFGIISQGVGMVAGLVVGGVSTAIYCGATGWDTTQNLAKDLYGSFVNGTIA